MAHVPPLVSFYLVRAEFGFVFLLQEEPGLGTGVAVCNCVTLKPSLHTTLISKREIKVRLPK